ncbi:MAG: DUF5050 domain-containing protein [Verrucomicrobiota bacterium]
MSEFPDHAGGTTGGNLHGSSLPAIFLRVMFGLSIFMAQALAQTGLFSSSPYSSSPRIGQRTFDGSNPQALVATTGNSLGGILTTDGRYIYWANPLAINRTHLVTRVTETLASFDPGAFDPRGITTDGYRLYVSSYVDGKIISEYDMEGHLVRKVGTPVRLLTGMTTDGIFIYWSDEEDGLYRMKMDGTERALIRSERNIMGMTADSSHLYWANDRDELIRRCGLDGSNPETLVDLRQLFGTNANYYASGLAVTGTHVYWGELGTNKGIYRCDLTGANAVRLSTTSYSGESSLSAFPSALFPEAMEPVRPGLAYDAAAQSATLAWPSLANRRYQLLKSVNLKDFVQTGNLINSNSAGTSATFSSPDMEAFFVVRKLPGTVAP